jgi:rubrerythrin
MKEACGLASSSYVGEARDLPRNSRNESRCTPKRLDARSAIHKDMDDRMRVDLRCRGCGYGIVVAGDPPTCPLCRGRDWEPISTSFPQRLGSDADAGEAVAAHDR